MRFSTENWPYIGNDQR